MVWRRWLNHRELPAGGVLLEERSFVRARAAFRRTLTRRFFGLGPGTEESDETSYTDTVIVGEIGLQRTWPEPGSDFIWRIGARGEYHWLSSGEVGGKPSMDDSRDAGGFPEIFRDGDGRGLGWLEAGLRWDTRDSQVNPYRGFSVGAKVEAALAQDDGDLGAIYTFQGTKVLAVPGLFHDGGDPGEANPPTDTVAFGLLAQLSSGDLPFYARPTLGGSTLARGYIDGRWRDDAAWLGSAEWRFWVIPRGFPIWKSIRVERVGLAAFYELGSVAGDGAGLFDAQLNHTYGFGVRVTLERAAPFRVDVGFSEDGANVSARFGLSF